jgi:hypothetical protein
MLVHSDYSPPILPSPSLLRAEYCSDQMIHNNSELENSEFELSYSWLYIELFLMEMISKWRCEYEDDA